MRVFKQFLPLVVCLCALGVPLPAFAQSLVVTRNVTIRAEPVQGSEPVEFVEPEDTLELLDGGQRRNNYYHVQLPGDRDGWVYQTFVRRVQESQAAAASSVSATELSVHFIDVDQGSAALLEFPCAAVLIDVGGRGDDAAMHMLAYLRSFFDRRPDLQRRLAAVFVTHTHVDHNSNLKRLIDGRLPVGSYVHNGLLNGSGQADARWMDGYRTQQRPAIVNSPIAQSEVVAAQRAGLTNAAIDPVACPQIDPQIRVLAGGRATNPGWSTEDFRNGNNHSVVVRVDFGDSSFLFLGDLENAGIEEMLQRYAGTNLLDADVLVVSHHGAANGTTSALLNAVSPDMAIMSMGPERVHEQWTAYAYGHPRATTVDALRQAVSGTRPTKRVLVASGVKNFFGLDLDRAIYGTGWDGDVVVTANRNGQLSVRTSR